MRFRHMTRINPGTGGVERPWRNRNHAFTLAPLCRLSGSPDYAAQREVDNYGEALEWVRGGFAIAMSDGQSPPALIAPDWLTMSDRPCEMLDDLWTCGIPKPPFPKSALDEDIRQTLIGFSSAVQAVVNLDASRLCVANQGVDGTKRSKPADIDGFNLTRLAYGAYETAFRAGFDSLLSGQEVLQLNDVAPVIFKYMHGAGSDGQPGKLSPLRHTMICALTRWKLSRCALNDCTWGISVTETLAELAGMSYQSVRNSLASAGIRMAKDRLCHDTIVRWLESRRNFVPLRLNEHPRIGPTREALALLQSHPLGEISQRGVRQGTTFDSVARLERRISASLQREGCAPGALLRPYARALHLCIDSFVAGFGEHFDHRRAGAVVLA